MNFKWPEAVELLERTPNVLEQLLAGLSEEWLRCNEGEGTWNAAEVVEHLIEGEKRNWIPRLAFIFQEGKSKPFPAFDRFAHLNAEAPRRVEESLAEFKALRAQNIERLKAFAEVHAHFEQEGLHPTLGVVKARELLSTWVAHDLTHIAQIVRVMAKRYSADVGAFEVNLSILK